MSEHTDNIQIIEQNGAPAFAVLPWDMFERIRPSLQAQDKLRTGIPQAVIRTSFDRNIPLLLAWREYLGLSQSEVAVQAGMKQPALSRIEKGESKPQAITIKRIADAMGLSVEQLGI
ncbi:MAG: helix-turn-helix transcriptional regulator [Gallionellaceae bacterium]